MGEVFLARWQFGITTVYHFLFVPLTLGLSILVALMETAYVRTNNPVYKQMAKFWGKLFLVNFSVGVVTGIVQEFHFGMNWSEYSRFMGDIFGAPLALEALTAFFLESTFLGIWIFGWDRLSKKLHALCIWIVALSSNLSAFWILTANSFMQSPAGYALKNGRAEMTDFMALIKNPYVWNQFPHTVLAGLVTAGIFVMAISAYHLLKKTHLDFFRSSYKIGVICTLLCGFLVMGTGHLQTQYVAKVQPMKLASMEALWESADPAPFAIAAVIDEKNQENPAELAVPYALTVLAHDSFTGEVKGIKELQQLYTDKYGPGNYIPAVTQLFWCFRIMIVSGMWMLLLAVVSVLAWYLKRLESSAYLLKAVLWSLPVPYLANSTGWFVTEGGRQPWIVYGLQKVSQAVSPNVTATELWISLTGFTLVYGVLAIAAIYLARKFVLKGPEKEQPVRAGTAKEATLWS
ncbi:cytochrome ubiquinol oxidase subunit I [Propionispora vibrioides]|uniref:Cytochrome bd-I ubiquinol oxidase subunit 1 apoprotein n=1 Tax=Propionispora vibrioides TaxID=112903 RepID=A0A1H8TBJ9_9FIRM|nr:cytochrome ubiquinol oxidase subunit I [Propionispora vibrioides]SEO88261.1 cytochrome bd-I ubiquinol oxidase subunit 1 apoprotein [Propionispora vibrioides]